jgi:endonuclease-3
LKPMLSQSCWKKVLSIIAEEVKGSLSSVSQIERGDYDPFRVLISTIISLRTRDEVTLAASTRLLGRADCPRDMVELTQDEIAHLIYPAGFYNTKAGNILQICATLLENYDGKVPREKERLMALPGVGLKTANLVLSRGHNIPAICVDIHVHRIANRMGWVVTKNPDKTEEKLREILPLEFWIPINELLVLYGQKICTPQSPRCSVCRVYDFCERVGVDRRR